MKKVYVSTRFFFYTIVGKKEQSSLTFAVGFNVQETKKRMKSSGVAEAEVGGFAVQVANGAKKKENYNHRDQIREILCALGTVAGSSCRNRGGSSRGGGLGVALHWSVVGHRGFLGGGGTGGDGFAGHVEVLGLVFRGAAVEIIDTARKIRDLRF